MIEACMWCHGVFEQFDGPTHAYTESTPGCWKAYGEVLAREYENYPELSGAHRLSVDTYAVQHPGQVSRRATQSVHAHLMALYYSLEKEAPARVAKAALVTFMRSGPNLEWLEPPDFAGTLTVADVLAADGPLGHPQLVDKWARSVWDRWKDLHLDRIERNAAAAFV